MIRASVMYRREPGKKFDFEYYINKHLAMVHDRLSPLGLIRFEVDRAADDTSPFIAAGHLYFNSLEEFQNGFAAHATEIIADVSNYTDALGDMQVSEILK